MKRLAAEVALKADAWNAAAYRAFHDAGSPEHDVLDAMTETHRGAERVVGRRHARLRRVTTSSQSSPVEFRFKS